MNPELQKELFARLDALCAKLGIAAGMLWQTLLRQARVEAVSDTLWAALFAASLVWLAVRWRRIRKWMGVSGDRGWAILPVLIWTFVGSMFLHALLKAALTEWWNPGYYAWNELLDKLK